LPSLPMRTADAALPSLPMRIADAALPSLPMRIADAALPSLPLHGLCFTRIAMHLRVEASG